MEEVDGRGGGDGVGGGGGGGGGRRGRPGVVGGSHPDRTTYDPMEGIESYGAGGEKGREEEDLAAESLAAAHHLLGFF